MKANIDIAIVLSPGCALSGVMGVVDMLSTANYVAQRTPGVSRQFRPRLVAAGGGAVQGFSGFSLWAQEALPGPAELDAVVVASGPTSVLGPARMQAALAEQGELLAWLRAAYTQGLLLASCCTGSLLLAAAGLLDGRMATTHWRAERSFRQLFPQVELRLDSLLIVDDRLISGGGAQAFSSVVLHLIERYLGEAVAATTAKLMLAEGQQEGQLAFRQWLPQQDHGDALVGAAQAWLEQHYREAFELEGFAARFNLTPRTLMRRFKQATGLAPLQYQQRLRVEAAKQALETSATPINRVVWQIGYEDLSSFQRLFKRETGLGMAEYRQRFGGRRLGARAEH